jgi:hypothetical protein
MRWHCWLHRVASRETEFLEIWQADFDYQRPMGVSIRNAADYHERQVIGSLVYLLANQYDYITLICE